MNQETNTLTPELTPHFKNLGAPVPEKDPFHWVENQRIIDLHTLLAALNQAVNHFRKRETETPKEVYSVLKGRALDAGDFVFKADIVFWDKTHAILIWQEIAAHIGANQTHGTYGERGTWSLTW